MEDFKFSVYLFLSFLIGIVTLLAFIAILSYFLMPLHPIRFTASLIIGIPAVVCFVWYPIICFFDNLLN